jgi:signal transduction histidine kinase
MRQTDWSATPLGDPETWPKSLLTMLSMLLRSRYQMWLGWGPNLHFFYNDAYRPTLGAKHPKSLAAPTRELWAEIWHDIGPRIQHVLDTGEATWDEALLLMLERHGYPEETYHTFSYSPIPHDDGSIAGMLSVVTEETERIVSERRLALVREVSSRLAAANTVVDVARAVEAAWPVADRDLPFTLLYLFDAAGTRATLLAQTGMPPNHPAAPPDLAIAESPIWPLSRVIAENTPIHLTRLPESCAWPTGPWNSLPAGAILTPFAHQGQSGPAGVFISGVNPHRPCDEAYRSFLSLFVGQIAAGLANVRAYEAERLRAESLAELDRAKTIFFSNVSHEFRTPLTLMLGPIEDLVSRGDLDAETHRQLSLIRRNGARLLRLVNTLLDFSRIEAGRAQARYEPVDLSEYTRDLASVFGSATERAGLQLNVDCETVGEPVYVDRSMWEKVVLNLLSNAFKFTFAGEIAVSLRRTEGEVQLRVRDTGVGIPEHELPKLFERFHRVSGVTGRSHEGSGIGLALVHELVKLHGGTVHVESELGKGSTFTVAVPLGRSHLPAEHVHESVGSSSLPNANLYVEEALQWVPVQRAEDGGGSVLLSSADRTATSVRILVVDDSADMRDYISRLLAPRWQVETAANGRAALAAIARERPHLVITDMMMPELDGFGLLQALTRDPAMANVPVLVLSARAGDEARMEGLEAGAGDYLVKPFSGRELLARVEALLLRARIRAVEEAHARRLASVFAQAPAAIAIMRGPDHVFELANAAYLALVNDRGVVGKPVREALPEVQSQGIIDLLDHVYRTQTPYIGRSLPLVVNRTAHGDPERRYFDFVYQPLLDEDGRAEGIAAVVYDVTELTRARQAAEVANRAKDEFLAMLGHELRNPLAPILTALQLLQLRGVQAGERERQIIERQVKHLVGLVDDLLDVSRITRGKIQLRRRTVELSEAVARAIETASPLFEQKRHMVSVDVPREGLAVDGDPERLAQIVANLLTNAGKYTQDGGRINITGRAEGNHVALSVRDTGIGIAPDMVPRIFDLFVQERQAIDRAQGGLGLGLAIVRSLAALHGGEVEAHSEGMGRGAEFVLRLPRVSSGAATAPAPAAAQPDVVAPQTARARRVLVVDDNHDAATLLAEALSVRGHAVRTAHDGLSGLRAAESFLPDVALIDIGLPVMDGYEVARQLSDHPRLKGIRLIAVTGYGQEQDRARSRNAGFVGHLVKPVELNQVHTLVESASMGEGLSSAEAVR